MSIGKEPDEGKLQVWFCKGRSKFLTLMNLLTKGRGLYMSTRQNQEIVTQLKTLFENVGVNIFEEHISQGEQLGIDSLQFVTVICDIENTFKIIVPDEYLSFEKLRTFNDYLDMIKVLIEENNKLFM